MATKQNKSSLRALREDVERRELEVRKRLLEANASCFESFVDPREAYFDAEDQWLPVGHAGGLPTDSRKLGEVLPVYLDEAGLKAVRDQSRRLLAFNEFAINAIENRVNYVCGRGFQYKVLRKGTSPSGQDELAAAAQKVLDDFYDAQHWGEREQECVRRCDRDGEAFLRFFYLGAGQSAVRFIEPEHVRGPGGTQACSFGIETDADDVELPLAYHVIERPAAASGETSPVPADDIVHIKLNVDSTAKRGLPTLLPVRKNLDRAEKLLRNMSVLAQVQATFALIRRHRSQPASAVEAYRREQSEATVPGRSGRVRHLQQLAPGTILDAPDSTEYQFPAMGVAAGQLVTILQAELRAIAARLCLPEYMLSADASNANYSSTLVAEAPATRNFERLQAFFARRFGDGSYAGGHSGVMWRVLARAVEHARLPAEALSELDIQVEGPAPAARERHQESQRAKLLHDAGVMSRQTWAKFEGLEFEREQRQLFQEKVPSPQRHRGTESQ